MRIYLYDRKLYTCMHVTCTCIKFCKLQCRSIIIIIIIGVRNQYNNYNNRDYITIITSQFYRIPVLLLIMRGYRPSLVPRRSGEGAKDSFSFAPPPERLGTRLI